MEPQSIWFGLAGGDLWAPDGNGRTGQVNRVVELCVRYRPPPTSVGIRLWTPDGHDPSGKEQWTMPDLPAAAGRPTELRTLFGLAERLRPRRGQVPPTDPDLAELDWVVRALLAAVGRLHAAGRSIGLIHPLNVLWYTVREPDLKPRRVLVLPDVGFVAADGSAEVRWLWNAVEVEQKKLRPATLEQVQELAFRKGWYPDPREVYRKFNPKQEAVAVARVLDWVVSGQVRTAVPSKEDDPVSRLSVYGVLAGAVAGKVAGVAALAAVLLPNRGNRVVQAFLKQPIDPKQPGRPWLRWAVVLALLVAVPAGGWVAVDYLRLSGPQEEVDPIYPDLPAGSAVRPHLKQLAGLLARKTNPPDDPDELLKWLGDMTRVVQEAGDAQAAAPQADPAAADKERACLGVMRGLVRDRYDDHLVRFRELKRVSGASIGTDAGNRVIRGWTTLATDLTRQTRELLPTILEEQPWRPTWIEAIEAFGKAAAVR